MKAIVITTTLAQSTTEQATSSVIPADQAATDGPSAVKAPVDARPPSIPNTKGSETDDNELIGLDETGWSGSFNVAYLFALFGFAILGAVLWYSGGAKLFRRTARNSKGKYRKLDEDIERGD